MLATASRKLTLRASPASRKQIFLALGSRENLAPLEERHKGAKVGLAWGGQS